MAESNTQSVPVTSLEQGSRPTFAERLPEVAAALRELEVLRVLARYVSPDQEWAIAFTGVNLRPVVNMKCALLWPAIRGELEAILQQRHPTWFDRDGSRGIFTWDVERDILQHHHTLIHPPL